MYVMSCCSVCFVLFKVFVFVGAILSLKFVCYILSLNIAIGSFYICNLTDFALSDIEKDL